MQHRQSSSTAWPALAAALAGVLLFGALAYRLVPPAAAVVQVPFFPYGPQPLRCASCGWIEAKRELAPLAAADSQALKIYEYTLRMQDGSMSVFQETLPTSWRLGERVMLIESDGALD
jgi:hypothetical protein